MEAAKYDDIIRFIARDHSVEPVSFWSHTLYAPDLVLKTNNGMAPKSYREFRRLLPYLGRPEEPCPEPNSISVMLNQGPTAELKLPMGTYPPYRILGLDLRRHSTPTLGLEEKPKHSLDSPVSAAREQPSATILCHY